MRLVRALVVPAVVAAFAVAGAPPAAACAGTECYLTCVRSVIDGDLEIYCPL